MDDLKLFAKNDKELQELLGIVKDYSTSIKMMFNTDKCAKLTMKRGQHSKSSNITLDPGTTIRELDNHEEYKYLGISEGAGISHNKMKDKLKKEYIRRIRLVLKSQLNSKNKINAINSLAIPILLYSFPIINWTMGEIKAIDIKTRKLLTCNRAHHPKADVDRLYLKRSEGGRGLLQVEMNFKISFIGQQKYLENTKDWMMTCVRAHDSQKKRYSIRKKSEDYKKDLGVDIVDESAHITGNVITDAKAAKKIAKKAALNKLDTNWRSKALHGKFAERASKADVNQECTFLWLKSSNLKAETEGFIIAAQDQSLKTNNYLKNIMKVGGDGKCRYCKEQLETIDHLVSGCSTLAKSEYIIRHNKVAQYIHWKVCQHYDMEVNNKWYEHQTEPVMENSKATILWDFAIQTDRTIKANRPDLVIRDKKTRTCLLLDVSIPTDKNTSLKTFEKLSKYKDLDIELSKSWKVKTKTIPIIIGALGVINRSTPKYVKEVPGKISISELQKITLLGTSRILRKALSLNAL